MDHVLRMMHLVAVFLFVRVACGTSYAAGPGAANNGHTAKKSPMDYSRYAEDARDIAHHNPPRDPHSVNTCDGRYELKNSTIIRTKDSINDGADFVGDIKVEGPTECRWRCCQKDGQCDTAVFMGDNSKDKNCFLFKCWLGGTLKCQFSSHHWGYVSAVMGGFAVEPTTSRVDIDDSADDGGDEQDTNPNNDDDQSEDAVLAKPEEDTGDGTECRRDQIQCANGECILDRYVCNDVKDCTDGSDEMGCGYGAWKDWNDYNHHDNTYRPENHNGYDNEGDPGDDRTSDTDGDADGGAVGGDETPEGGEDEEAIADNETAGDEDNAVATEPNEPNEELADSPTVQSPPKSATQPKQPEQPGTPVPETSHGDQAQAGDITTKVHVGSDESQAEQPASNPVEPFGSHPATSAILPLAVGLIITLLLLMMLSCKLRYMNRRLRYGRLKTHAHDADYLINGMYL